MISKDLVAASSVPLILSILSHGEDYGYSIIKKVMAASDNQLVWKEGSLYPVLSKMEKKGLISSTVRMEKGRKRKYYSIHKSGSARLVELRQEWQLITNTMNTLWQYPSKAL